MDSALRRPGPSGEGASAYWWIFLLTGACWLLFSIIVFRFDYTSVSAISILFGIVMIGAGLVEAATIGFSTGWWKVARIVLAVAFFVIAIVAFIHPGNTFNALAAVISFYFVIKGSFDVVLALATRHEADTWWLGLTVGVIEILLGFWAAGDFGRKEILLVVWVGVTALTRGIAEILLAFSLRRPAAA
jgi:uncharacterized membrane protein HdeD (DUF308 family)